jgi:hypothetical protein
MMLFLLLFGTPSGVAGLGRTLAARPTASPPKVRDLATVSPHVASPPA